MKQAVILAHPRRRSVNGSIAAAYVEAAQSAGHEVIVRDLYAMRFDPRLSAAELPGAKPPRFRADVERERGLLAEVERFVFIYPLWFNAPPAILKGYVDRVFGLGFGFRPSFGGTEPALGGRSLLSITTSGAPEQWVRDTRAMEALQALFDRHLAKVTGMIVLDHIHFGDVIPGIRSDVVDDMVAAVRQIAGRLA